MCGTFVYIYFQLAFHMYDAKQKGFAIYMEYAYGFFNEIT